MYNQTKRRTCSSKTCIVVTSALTGGLLVGGIATADISNQHHLTKQNIGHDGSTSVDLVAKGSGRALLSDGAPTGQSVAQSMYWIPF